MKRLLVLAVLFTFALGTPAAAKRPTIPQAQRAISVYVEHLASDYRPADWYSTWVSTCERDFVEPTACGYGMRGVRHGERYDCAGVADVHYRRGHPFGWRRVLPTDIAAGRRYKIVPELSFECWGPESPITRIGY